MKKRFFKVLVIVLLVGLVAPTFTFGFSSFEIFPKNKKDSELKKFRLGRVQFHPGVALESKYNDNIFLQADSKNRNEDFIFTSKPSLGVELERVPGDIWGFNLEYQGEDERFVDLDGQDTFNHNVAGAFDFGGPGGQSNLKVRGGYDKSKNSQIFDFQTNVGSRVNIETYTGLLDFVYLLTKTTRLQLGTSFNEWRFEQPNQRLNSALYDFHGSISWQKSPLVAYSLIYNHSKKEYRNASNLLDDSNADQFILGAEWVGSAWISGGLFVGLNYKRFSKSTNKGSQNLVYIANLKYQPVERSQLTLRWSREVLDTTFLNVQFFVVNGGELNFTQRMGKKLQAEIFGKYESFDYQRPVGAVGRVRIDDRVEVSLALSYEIQDWLKVKAKHSYIENMSNFGAFSYYNNVSLLEISARY